MGKLICVQASYYDGKKEHFSTRFFCLPIMNEDMVQSHMKLLEGCDYQWVKISTLDQDLNILDCMGW